MGGARSPPSDSEDRDSVPARGVVIRPREHECKREKDAERHQRVDRERERDADGRRQRADGDGAELIFEVRPTP